MAFVYIYRIRVEILSQEKTSSKIKYSPPYEIPSYIFFEASWPSYSDTTCPNELKAPPSKNRKTFSTPYLVFKGLVFCFFFLVSFFQRNIWRRCGVEEIKKKKK